MSIIKKYPVVSFMVFLKTYWVISFFFTIYVIQNSMPTLRQFVLASIFTIVTLPFNYWLTYGFGAEKK